MTTAADPPPTFDGVRSPIERRTVAVAIGALAVAAVIGLLALDGLHTHGMHSHHVGGNAANTATIVLGTWLCMVLAMMLPTAMPLLAALDRLTHDRADHRLVIVLATAGFVAVWMLVGIGLFLVTAWIRAAFGYDATQQSTTGGIALVLAGGFQLSPLKARCLTACRRANGFLYRHWTGGRPRRDAATIGVAYGLSCAGCCWALMVMMPLVGFAHEAWMVGLGGVMALEKNWSKGPRLSLPVGVALIAAGIAVALVG